MKPLYSTFSRWLLTHRRLRGRNIVKFSSGDVEEFAMSLFMSFELHAASMARIVFSDERKFLSRFLKYAQNELGWKLVEVRKMSGGRRTYVMVISDEHSK